MKSSAEEFLHKNKTNLTLIASTILITVILVVGLYYVSSFEASGESITASIYVPIEFLEARRRAVNSANKIISLTEQSASNLEHINGADQRGDYTKGLELVTAEIDRGEDIRNTAVDLSEDLRDMAVTLGEVRPSDAATIGFRAMTVGIELVQRLISYNSNLQELFNTLQTRLESNGDEQTRTRIIELIGALNDEALVINNLGSEYGNLMIQFDGLTN